MKMTFGTQEFPWLQFYGFTGRQLADHLDEAFAAAAAAGLRAWEPTAPAEPEAPRIAELLRRHGLEMPSAYLNARLHTPEWRTAADQIVQRARIGHPLGLRMVVVNPEPVDWNRKDLDKSDDELRRQAEALVYLTGALQREGVTLAYHTHDAEMRNAAREFHHMLLATRQAGMKLCLDNHWIYRGAGNSQVALDDVLALYGDRIATLHVRQSRSGVWTETLGDGDVNFAPIVAALRRIDFSGPIIIEQAYETGTPRALSMTDSLRASLAWAQKTFVGR